MIELREANVLSSDGLTAKPLKDWLARAGELTINVKDFGAKGDGVTDDSAAIQLALNSVPSAGGEVFFPAGTYLVNTTIASTKAGLVLRGAGGNGWNVGAATSIKTTAAIIVFDFGSATATEHKGVRVCDLSVNDATNAGAGGLAVGAFRVRRQNHVSFERVSVNSFSGGYAFTLDGTGDAWILPRFDAVKGRVNKFGIVTLGTGTGLYTSPTTYFTSTLGTGSIGLQLSPNTDTSQLYGAFDSHDTAVLVKGNSHFIAGRYESNAIGVQVAAGTPTTTRNVITGCRFSSALGTQIGIQLDASTQNHIVAWNSYQNITTANMVVDNTGTIVDGTVLEPLASGANSIRRSIAGLTTLKFWNQKNGTTGDDAQVSAAAGSVGAIEAILRACLGGAGGGVNDVKVGSSTNTYVDVVTNATDIQMRARRNSEIAASETGILIQVNKAGVFSLAQVLIGAVDSGGTGFRVLRIAN